MENHNQEDRISCPICYESEVGLIDLNNWISLSCKHFYHKVCLERQISFNPGRVTCALCRQPHICETKVPLPPKMKNTIDPLFNWSITGSPIDVMKSVVNILRGECELIKEMIIVTLSIDKYEVVFRFIERVTENNIRQMTFAENLLIASRKGQVNYKILAVEFLKNAVRVKHFTPRKDESESFYNEFTEYFQKLQENGLLI